MQALIAKAKEFVKEDDDGVGYLIHEIFLKLPGRKDYPDYYKIIKDPVDIEKIEKLVQTDKIPTLLDFIRCWVAMFENAVIYNPPGAEVGLRVWVGGVE